MSRPVDNRLNRSGLGELSETDQKPLGGQDNPTPSGKVGSAPDEQSPGHDHDDPDSPDEVHPTLAREDAGSED